MGLQVWSESFECKVGAHRMWEGLFKDGHNCLPKALPLKVVAVEYPHHGAGFHFSGAERLIKLHKAMSNVLEKEEVIVKADVEKVDAAVHKEEAIAKADVEKVDDAVHKEALLVKAKEEEAECLAHKEACLAKEKEQAVGVAAHKEAHLLKEEEAIAASKGAQFVKGVAHAAASLPEKLLHKEAEEVHKVIDAAEKEVDKEEEKVSEAAKKVSEFLKEEELWIREKIEEVDNEAFKITITVLERGLIGLLFKHCKHTVELKDTSPHEQGGHAGSILHWTSEFEALSSGIHFAHSLDKLKQHAMESLHGVEDYLLHHGDYKTC